MGRIQNKDFTGTDNTSGMDRLDKYLCFPDFQRIEKALPGDGYNQRVGGGEKIIGRRNILFQNEPGAVF